MARRKLKVIRKNSTSNIENNIVTENENVTVEVKNESTKTLSKKYSYFILFLVVLYPYIFYKLFIG
jgi:hypothetical protein